MMRRTSTAKKNNSFIKIINKAKPPAIRAVFLLITGINFSVFLNDISISLDILYRIVKETVKRNIKKYAIPTKTDETTWFAGK